MKAVVAALNQEKALVGAFSVITNLRMELFEALEYNIRSELLPDDDGARPGGDQPLALAAARRGEAGQHWRPLHAAAGRPGPGPRPGGGPARRGEDCHQPRARSGAGQIMMEIKPVSDV